jgi:bifunctional DNA-binding transcriptional regulator/antitoxin component of YhaV-PrlF toxin-antitoxin module
MQPLKCTLTERGQVSLPASLRKKMGLSPGRVLRWEAVSSTEARVIVEPPGAPDPLQALGFGPRLRRAAARSTSDWMSEIRGAE